MDIDWDLLKITFNGVIKLSVIKQALDDWEGSLNVKIGEMSMSIYTGAGHIIRISSKSWFISLIPFKKVKLV